MSFTPIAKDSLDWDVPVNAAFTDQDTRIDSNTSSIATLNTSVSNLQASRNNVKSFGAIGDGVADDTIAIQNAINAGGITYFPVGTYLVSGLTVLAGTVLEGVGRNGYIASASTQCATLKLKSGANAHILTGADQKSNVIIRDMNFDGNKANNTSGDIIHLDDASAQDTAWHMYDCFLDNAAHDGVYVGTGRQAVKINRTWIMRSTNNGVTLNGADGGLETVLIGLSGSNGVYCGAWVQHLNNCDIWSAGSNGVLCDNVHMVSITNCGIDRHAQSGVVVQTGGSVAISNNMFHSNSQSANNTYPHISVTSGQVAITANTFATDGLANNPNYAINVTAGTVREWANNQVSGSFVTGYINNASFVNNFVVGSLSMDATRQINVGASGSGSTFVANRTNATDGLISGRITGDTVNRFSATVGGSISWGPGGSTAQDVTLARSGTGVLQLTTGTLDMASKKITSLANGSAATDAAAFGQIPVAGTTAGTYAAGNDTRITGALQSANNLSDVAAPVTSAQNIGLVAKATGLAESNATTTLQASTSLVVPLKANATYLMHGNVCWTNNTAGNGTSTGGFKHSFTGPSGATLVWADSSGSQLATISTVDNWSTPTSANATVFNAITGVLTTSATAGNLTLTFAPQFSGTAQLLPGSNIQLTRIA